jgi:hypothetical protein
MTSESINFKALNACRALKYFNSLRFAELMSLIKHDHILNQANTRNYQHTYASLLN